MHMRVYADTCNMCIRLCVQINNRSYNFQYSYPRIRLLEH